MQAIETKALAPSYHRNARIVAECYAKRKIYEWVDELSIEENHIRAAKRLCRELGWSEDMVTGSLKGGSYVHVHVPTPMVKP